MRYGGPRSFGSAIGRSSIPNGAEQRIPAVEVLPFCDQVDGQEKPSATRVLTAGSNTSQTRKGNQIQSHQCVRQPVAAVAEIVLHVVAIVFQQIKAFIFNSNAPVRMRQWFQRCGSLPGK